MILKLQRTDRVRDPLDSILNRMSKVIHRIDTPFITGIMVCHMGHTVNDRISHIDVRRCHIDLSAQHLLSVLIFSRTHLLEQLQVFLYRTIAIWAFFSRLCQRAAVLPHLFRREIAYKRFSLFDQPDCTFVHLVKIIRRKIEMLSPVSAQPFDIFFNRIHELHLLFRRIRVVKSHVECAAILLCKAIIQKDRFGMPDMEISVRLRREPRTDMIVYTFRKIFIYFLLYKIL